MTKNEIILKALKWMPYDEAIDLSDYLRVVKRSDDKLCLSYKLTHECNECTITYDVAIELIDLICK